MNNTIKLIISIAIPLAVGALGNLFTSPEIPGWFQTIRKPSWNPPNWIFGPVWTTLYVLMGIAFFIVWKSNTSVLHKKQAIVGFFIQLLLNLGWSFIFFYLHEIGGAFIEIILLWTAIVVCIFLFARVSKIAAWLMVPYISWVSFALLLNYTIWQLNG